MGFLDRLFGTNSSKPQVPPVPQNPYSPGLGQQQGYSQPPSAPGMQPPKSEDELAIERYRYLLRTAPPQTIEQVHAEAFSKLSPAQRQQVLAELKAGLPPYEQPQASDPQTLARAATRAEYMNPGFMERTLGPQGRQGPSFGSMVGGSLLGTVAGYVIGSAIVSSFMAPSFAYDAGYQDGSDASGADGGTDAGTDAGADAGADASAWGDSGSGWGGDGGGFGDFGGGDFGGGDFGF
ncbi:hypothetical protein G5T42_16270 [Microbacterium sp. 4R-513]|uniref:hypothetical protein n=1 Tax=Microbacterium sp. 4R-513 TaxID=2567934 RepID=UPI0013E1656A|nr:hypothetical protein [Microbacterium sp. 4R-513]QIG40837.1 hypothetical protein G5T42_16270 [Microbacterium sp. 4R-513]